MLLKAVENTLLSFYDKKKKKMLQCDVILAKVLNNCETVLNWKF